MERNNHYIIFIAGIFFLWGCRAPQQTVQPRTSEPEATYQYFLIDSILQYGLDHEALYTMWGDIKPMSSLVSFSFPIANADTVSSVRRDIVNREEQGVWLDRLYEIQQALNKVSLPDLRFIMSPYRASYSGDRIMQVNVIRVSALDSLLKAQESFFGQFGLIPGTDPAIVLNTIEFNDRYERLRGYGYLFGYPDYAIDFFVKAFHESDSTGEFVERNFFQIPVYSNEEGYFVYAYPKDHVPTAHVDSVIYYKAGKILKQYEEVRHRYLNPDSTLRSYELLNERLHK